MWDYANKNHNQIPAFKEHIQKLIKRFCELLKRVELFSSSITGSRIPKVHSKFNLNDDYFDL